MSEINESRPRCRLLLRETTGKLEGRVEWRNDAASTYTSQYGFKNASRAQNLNFAGGEGIVWLSRPGTGNEQRMQVLIRYHISIKGPDVCTSSLLYEVYGMGTYIYIYM